MEGYFRNEQPLLRETKLPISANRSPWTIEKSPERLTKEYEFKEEFRVLDFISDLLKYQKQIGHHAKITIEAKKVTVEVYTHVVESVTEIDKEYAKAADEIYENAKLYKE